MNIKSIIRKFIPLQFIKFILNKFQKETEILIVEIKNGTLHKIESKAGFQTRSESTLKMITDAIIQTQAFPKVNKKLIFHLGDYPKGKIKPHHYYYCCSKKENIGNLIPDFCLESWPQVGIKNFDETAHKISKAGENEYIYDRMVWIGNTQTHKNRAIFFEIAKQNPDIIEAYDTLAHVVLSEKNKNGGKDKKYLSMEEHTQYKYLIDIEGNGYSGRLAMFLFSRRLLFIQERKWKQYYMFDLIPYKHFIPVKNDFSDLLQKINETEQKGKNYYNKIAQNAFEFAQKNLTYKKQVEKFIEVIYGNE